MSLPYALILNGVVDEIALWDGIQQWNPVSSNGTAYDIPPVPLVVNDVAVVDANNNPVQEGATYSAQGVFTNPAPVVTKPVLPPAPVITSPNTVSVKVGQYFIYQITATNNPTSYGVTPLVNGFTLDSELGILSGVPQGPGTGALTILLSTNAGGTGTMQLTGTAS